MLDAIGNGTPEAIGFGFLESDFGMDSHLVLWYDANSLIAWLLGAVLWAIVDIMDIYQKLHSRQCSVNHYLSLLCCLLVPSLFRLAVIESDTAVFDLPKLRAKVSAGITSIASCLPASSAYSALDGLRPCLTINSCICLGCECKWRWACCAGWLPAPGLSAA